jgi:hypothetical protein
VQGVENSTAEVAEDSSLVAAVERVDSPYIPNNLLVNLVIMKVEV